MNMPKRTLRNSAPLLIAFLLFFGTGESAVGQDLSETSRLLSLAADSASAELVRNTVGLAQGPRAVSRTAIPGPVARNPSDQVLLTDHSREVAVDVAATLGARVVEDLKAIYRCRSEVEREVCALEDASMLLQMSYPMIHDGHATVIVVIWYESDPSDTLVEIGRAAGATEEQVRAATEGVHSVAFQIEMRRTQVGDWEFVRSRGVQASS